MSTLKIESRGLQEVFVEYLMMNMKAKMSWVPYARKIRHRKLRQDIDFNILEFKIWGLTEITGFYLK